MKQRQHGASLIEFMVCFLIFIPIVALSAQLGKLIEQKQLTHKAAQPSCVHFTDPASRSPLFGGLPGGSFMTQFRDSDQLNCDEFLPLEVRVPAVFGTLISQSECGSSASIPQTEVRCVELPHEFLLSKDLDRR